MTPRQQLSCLTQVLTKYRRTVGIFIYTAGLLVGEAAETGYK